MDEMKRAHQIDAAMREVTQRRDEALTNPPALSTARRVFLMDFLTRQFPVETTLREVAAKRDKALHQIPTRIPSAVESILHRELAAGEPAPDISGGPLWLRNLRSPLAAVLTACALMTAALLGLGYWKASRREVMKPPAIPSGDQIRVEAGMEPFTQAVAIAPFHLNTNEPASLQAWFLADRRLRFANGNDPPFGLRLDLPGRAALMEDGLARTP